MSDRFARIDPSDDARFYAVDRKVVHIEQGAIDALTACYRDIVPPDAAVLDLMSSWRSHLPGGHARVVGLGMNAAEMADNPQLDEWVVHDLNRSPRMPFDDNVFDAVVCAVSVQYLIQPVAVLADARRVLRPGGPVVVSFSNRCFPTKAVAVWLSTTDAQHRALVRSYLDGAGYTAIDDRAVPTTDDPLYVVTGRA